MGGSTGGVKGTRGIETGEIYLNLQFALNFSSSLGCFESSLDFHWGAILMKGLGFTLLDEFERVILPKYILPKYVQSKYFRFSRP
jgi:hypothetical protein